jgi:hypothetical protein
VSNSKYIQLMTLLNTFKVMLKNAKLKTDEVSDLCDMISSLEEDLSNMESED